MLPHGHEHLLGDVLGSLPLRKRPNGEPVDEAGVSVVQVDQSRLVTASEALDQNPFRPWRPMTFIHEANPLHNHHSKPAAEKDHPTRARRARCCAELASVPRSATTSLRYRRWASCVARAAVMA
jgi:hypothetical protein